MLSFFIFFKTAFLSIVILTGLSTSALSSEKPLIVVTPHICHILLKEKDVAYQPNIDSKGNPLVPVDLQPPASAFIDKGVIPLEAPLSSLKPFGKKAQLGEITFDIKTSQIFFNNEPLLEKQKDLLRKACIRGGYK